MVSRPSTPSEGEIVDSGSDKAKSRSPSYGSHVNRQSRRPPVRYSRSPSPTISDYRSRQNARHGRKDDHYGGHGSRRHRAYQDDRRTGRGDRYYRDEKERRERRRSRSPPHFRDVDARHGTHDDRRRTKVANDKEQSVSNRSEAPSATVELERSAEISESQMQQDGDSPAIASLATEAPEQKLQVDVDALREQKRERWKAISAKHRSHPGTPLLVQALDSPAALPTNSGRATPKSMSSRSPTPMDFSNDSELANNHQNEETQDDGPSAADYDPTQDMQEDKLKHDHRLRDGAEAGVTSNQYEQSGLSGHQTNEAEVKDDFDMFADNDNDDDDMFASTSPADLKKTSAAKGLKMNTLDDWDDEEGYYKIILGELLDDRYHVKSNLGKGMFSGVVRAEDRVTQKLVAIKLIRSNETMRKAAAKEIDILEKLKAADPEDKRHVVRLERSFEHKGHLCMVFENLHENLREVLKKFGRDVGIELQAVRVYAQQIFKGLGLLRKCNILHADLKPDNILVNDRRSWLKICDLGSASDASENEITPYLVSRFYRAPEIILGMPYDFGIDTWSIGCTLYELFTGKILFAGRSNNQMLRVFMECRGRIPTRMLKRSEYAYLHFDEAGIFRSVEKEKITGKDIVRMQNYLKPTRDLRSRLSTKGMSEAETKDLNLFIDLLDKCLILNPEKRILPADALKHPFLTREKLQ